MSEYRKGYRFERSVKKYLEARGYFVVRAAGSKPIDLVVFSRDQCFILECKTNKKNIRKKDIEFLRKLHQTISIRPVLAYRNKNKIIFIDVIADEEILFPHINGIEPYIGDEK